MNGIYIVAHKTDLYIYQFMPIELKWWQKWMWWKPLTEKCLINVIQQGFFLFYENPFLSLLPSMTFEDENGNKLTEDIDYELTIFESNDNEPLTKVLTD